MRHFLACMSDATRTIIVVGICLLSLASCSGGSSNVASGGTYVPGVFESPVAYYSQRTIPAGPVALVECPLAYAVVPIAQGKVFETITLPYATPKPVAGYAHAIKPTQPGGNIININESGINVRAPLVGMGAPIRGIAVGNSGIAYVGATEAVWLKNYRGRSGGVVMPTIDPINLTTGKVGPPIWFSTESSLLGNWMGNEALTVAARSDIAVMLAPRLLPLVLRPGTVNDSPYILGQQKAVGGFVTGTSSVALSPDGQKLYAFVGRVTDPFASASSLYSAQLNIRDNQVYIIKVVKRSIPPGIVYAAIATGADNQLFVLEEIYSRLVPHYMTHAAILDINTSTFKLISTTPIPSSLSTSDAGFSDPTGQGISVLPGTNDTVLVRVVAPVHHNGVLANQIILWVVNTAKGLAEPVRVPRNIPGTGMLTVRDSSVTPNGRFIYVLWQRNGVGGDVHYFVTEYSLPQLMPIWSVPFVCPASPLTGARNSMPTTIASVVKG